jgi:hypothetical protein
MPGASNRCLECHGSGNCTECFASGVNVHLNASEPQCTACNGTGRCGTCNGTGLLRREKSWIEMPLGLRCLLSAIPIFILYKVLIDQAPVHWGGAFGRGGDPALPKLVGWVSVVGVCGPVLFALWRDVQRDDFVFGKSGLLPSLTCGHTATDQCPCACHSCIQICRSAPCCTRCPYCGRRIAGSTSLP